MVIKHISNVLLTGYQAVSNLERVNTTALSGFVGCQVDDPQISREQDPASLILSAKN